MSKPIVLITGASSGFGEACAKKYNENGYPIILIARRIEKLEAIKSKLNANYPIYLSKVDVTKPEEIQRFISELPENFRNIQVLINNAGLALGLGSFEETLSEDNDQMIQTNINGLVNFTKSVLPIMVKNDIGHIINIGSIAGSWPYPGGNIYCATKAFVQQFSRCLRADLIGKNIRVSNIEPGLAHTGYSEVRFKGDTEKANGLYEKTNPLVAGDIAEIIYFTTSLSAHININSLEVMPTCQAWSALTIAKQ
jgi:NADP-dependent 3-hydroxy acid dehydrogenase YdfG